MDKNGKVYGDEKELPWDVTILNKTITLFSNGYYLDITNDTYNIIGSPYMRIWNFEIIDENYYFKSPKKNENNILSIGKDKIKVKSIAGKNEKFRLIDIPDSCNDIPDTSFLSSKSTLNFNSINKNLDTNTSSLSGKIFNIIDTSGNSF